MRWLTAVLVAVALLAPVWALQAAEPASGQIVYTRKEGDRFVLHLMNADGTGDRAISGVAAKANLLPVSSPDGKRIAFMSGTEFTGNDFGISIINTDGTGLKTLTVPSRPAGTPAWSPDGKQLAFTAGEMEPSVYIADAEGAASRRLNPMGHGGAFPFWAADGKRVGYTRFTQGQEMKTEIVLAQADGSKEEVIVPSSGLVLVGAHGLSADGKQLLYVNVDVMADSATLMIRDLAAKSDQALNEIKLGKLEGPYHFPSPAWAPDGKTFLVTIRDAKGAGVYRVSADGKTKTRLTPEGTDCSGGAWLGSPMAPGRLQD
jgi:Tol biopolymer transport system component